MGNLNVKGGVVLTALMMMVCFASSAGVAARDTTFILRERAAAFYHAIFIETSKSSVFYDQISDFSFGEFDWRSYENSLEYLKEHNIRLTRRVIKAPARRWINLKQYQGNFYVYRPSDFMCHYMVSVTDSAFIDYGCEGPEAHKIVDYRKLDSKTFRFDLTGMSFVNKNNRTLIIHIIDAQKGIAVFEERYDTESTYQLMIDADKLRSVPIIVNYCETEKTTELEFDVPDFTTLLKNK